MNRTEHLLTIVVEECAELAKNATKALRFGLTDHEPGPHESNAERIVQEFHDLHAVIEMLMDEGAIPKRYDGIAMIRKREKVEKFLRYSVECGTLSAPPQS
jgi:hypothetical protein